MNEFQWGLTGAKVVPPIPGIDAFSATPLIDLLRNAAARDPDAVALIGQRSALSFRETLRRVQNVACFLADRVPPGQAIACLLPRTPEGVAALLGCLVSGRVGMVLDPANPASRQAVLLEDAAPAALLTDVPPPFACAAPILMPAASMAGPDRTWQADRVWDPDAPFSIHFTSGSSGLPKGIVLSARAMLYRGLTTVDMTGIGPDDRVLTLSAPVAGAGLAALLGVLAQGACVVLANVGTEGASAVLRLMERAQVTHATTAPSVLRLLMPLARAPAAFRHMRGLRIGSEPLPRSDLAVWRQKLPPDCAVLHTYASTEALIVASWKVPLADTGPEATVAAGMIQASHCYALVDNEDRPVPAGEPGELILRSRNIAMGEWRAGGLVPGRLPPAPGLPGYRIYRTGDIARVQTDGLLRVLGRADRQVKINGIRIEPAEIEAVLRSDPNVTDAAVIATGPPENVSLHGFVAANADHAALIMALRQRLANALPMSLRPARLTVLDRFPVLPSGKTDLLALANRSRSERT